MKQQEINQFTVNEKMSQIYKSRKKTHNQNKKKKNKSSKKLINQLKELVISFQIHFYIKKYLNLKQINCFYLRQSSKFKRLVHFPKAEPKLDASLSPILFSLFIKRRKNIMLNSQFERKNEEKIGNYKK
ncbi:hypothetical protein TTHERM_002653448 (macronuclear) [Tetrahymena thermophila SB210]|uniref:Uncharacterized protein n=1 Tax=Tetrahymena thermophila (strain SB210) TaxID=312017 RepID=W7XEE7_TETTS|nr:hypothetical protein TTHERM_002653448 [Tetrahymena thermophila SB210]EWS71259.1 hypothetical protein TTHERM_002653448 [Tetrahymena thermophila SB210]|eukprot:XP_012656203.1 hypothetical protein TTHERM_002653448 [Tetrahymena thermophila SB210]